MSRYLFRDEYDSGDFELGDKVSFDAPYGDRLIGEVVRVYNTRTVYHVEVNGDRFVVSPIEDRMSKEKN